MKQAQQCNKGKEPDNPAPFYRHWQDSRDGRCNEIQSKSRNHVYGSVTRVGQSQCFSQDAISFFFPESGHDVNTPIAASKIRLRRFLLCVIGRDRLDTSSLSLPRNSGTDGTLSDICPTRFVRLVMSGGFRERITSRLSPLAQCSQMRVSPSPPACATRPRTLVLA